MRSPANLPAFIQRSLFLLLVLAVLAAGGWALWRWSNGDSAHSYHTEPVVRGNLLATIGATGTLEPEDVVDVGAQVVGQIIHFGRDLDDSNKVIDYKSRVEEGTILAKIDDSLYGPEVRIARAELGQAAADEDRARAELAQAKAKLYQTERDWDRARKLGPTNVISQSDYDTIQNAYETAKAAVPAAEAALARAKQTVARSQAALDKAEENFKKTTIRSPINGVIVDRRVTIGQTVQSSFNTPSLFLIARDLKRMQVWASVNEADVGNIHDGQRVTFTVDAYPGQTFKGVVNKIRLNANMTQNVVTYTVEVNTDNSDGKLLPYMTANLLFEVDQRNDALLVPNAALRWRPPLQRVHPAHRDEYEQSLRRKAVRAENGPLAGDKQSRNRATIWVEDQGFVRPIRIHTGLTDGSMTEVVEVIKDELPVGTGIVTGENGNGEGGDTVNPFAPKVFGGGKKKE
jgi:HlyD family secretion protein